MTHPASKAEYFPSLDLCRGLAAIVVMFYHIGFLLSGWPMFLKRGYLCVDFFFLLSGYVIANSYERRLKSDLGLTEFAVLRLARLWPLLALTTVLGLIVQLPRFHRDFGGIDVSATIITTVFNASGLPTPASPTGFLFPLNPAAWSIFFELVANLAYVLLLPFLSGRMLLGLVAVSGGALLLVALGQNTIDTGWADWNILYGFPRVAFSFFLGVFMWRLGPDMLQAQSRGSASLFIVLLVTLVAFSVPLDLLGRFSGFYDALLVIVAFPILLLVAVRTRLGSRASAIALLLGGISYSVYLLQTPLMIAFSALPQVLLGKKIADFAPWAGVVFVPLCLFASYLMWTYFEKPAQRWLRARLLRRQKPFAAPQRVVDP